MEENTKAEQFLNLDEEQLQAVSGGTESEHDALVTSLKHEANAAYDRGVVSIEKNMPHVTVFAKQEFEAALNKINDANEREQQRLQQQQLKQSLSRPMGRSNARQRTYPYL
jgi:cysteine sulfinate desulfinase/cysteine desulfurase-like protein